MELSRTLYSLLQDSANEEGLFKAMNRAAYYLLDLGVSNSTGGDSLSNSSSNTTVQIPDKNDIHKDDSWYISFEDFIAGVQREPELCQFFAEQYILNLKGSSVDPILNPYTRVFMSNKT